MQLQFLGTGAGVPSKKRNVSSIALKLLPENNQIWLFDCGEATQHMILKTPIKPRKITKMFISHLHGDHIFGIPGFLSSRSHQGGVEPVDIYGPVGLEEYVRTTLKVSQSKLGYQLIFHELTHDGVVYEDNQFIVSTVKLEHIIPSYGFRIVEKDKVGHLDAHKLTELGIPAGPLYGKIKKGETITYGGKTICGSDFISPPVKGRRLAIIFDTRSCQQRYSLAKDVDVLVHEATFMSEEQNLAHSYYHSTIKDATDLAIKADAKHLLLTHISSRYVGESCSRFVAEAKSLFIQTKVMNDLECFEIVRED